VKHGFVLRWDARFGVGQMLNLKVDYLEVWCVPSATYWPCEHQS
jgi:hypothetical protein